MFKSVSSKPRQTYTLSYIKQIGSVIDQIRGSLRSPAQPDDTNRRITMKSYVAKPAEIERKWYVVDAEGQTLGRLTSQVAAVLRGKNKPTFTPFIDTGDYVIIVNADKIKVTGRKMDQKIYYRHSDYVGGMKETNLKEMMAKKPEEVIRLAVKGMLPKGPLGRQMAKKLFVYAGPEHKHAAQKPEVLELKY